MMSRSDVRGFVSRVHVSKVSGKLEVLDPEDDSLKWAETRKACMCDSRKFADKQQPINLQNGKLQVLGPTENVFIHSAESASRPGISPGRQGSAARRYCAPIKQISLCTVKPIAPSSKIPDYNVVGLKDSKKIDADPIQKEPEPPNIAEKESTEVHSASLHNPNRTEQPQESSSDEDESDSEKTAAPIELLAEFIKAVMDEDYKLAWKLCQMILIYEPENPEAKEFSPLIQKMLQNEEDLVGDEDDSEDTDEDDSSDTDDSDSSSTETSEESSEDETDD